MTATRTHAINLCKFVTIYKLLLILQKKLNGGKERDLDTFVAGGLGGWWVFGERTPVSLNLDVEKKVGSKFLLTMFLLTLIKTRSTSKWSSTSYPVLSFLSFLDFTTLHHHPKHLSNPSLTLSHHSLLPRRTQSPSHQPNYPLPFSPH